MSIERNSDYKADLAGGTLVVPAVQNGDVPHNEADTHVDQGTRDLTTTPVRILLGSVELPAQILIRPKTPGLTVLFAVTNSATPPSLADLNLFAGPGQEGVAGIRAGFYLHAACGGVASGQMQIWSHDYTPAGV